MGGKERPDGDGRGGNIQDKEKTAGGETNFYQRFCDSPPKRFTKEGHNKRGK